MPLTPFSRLRHLDLLRGRRGVRVRTILAAGLVLIGAVLAVRGTPQPATLPVVVAAVEIPAGTRLTEDHIRLSPRLVSDLPHGAIEDSALVVSELVAAPVAAGEILTPLRLVGPELAAQAAPAGWTLVPLTVADDPTASLLRAGVRIDVLAPVTRLNQHSDSDADQSPVGPGMPRVVAASAVVVSAPVAISQREVSVWIACAPEVARAVAAASVTEQLTVIIVG